MEDSVPQQNNHDTKATTAAAPDTAQTTMIRSEPDTVTDTSSQPNSSNSSGDDALRIRESADNTAPSSGLVIEASEGQQQGPGIGCGSGDGSVGEVSPPSSDNQVTVVGDKAVRSDIALSTLQQLYLPEQTDAYRKVNLQDKTLSFPHSPSFPSVKMLLNHERKRILVTGGAGFVGSHLVDRLMLMGHEVIVLDNFFTGSKRNVQHWLGHPHFELIRHDVVDPFMIEVDQIYHLACPASPPHYQYNPIKTVKTSVMGTINMLGLAKRTKARFLLTSTSGEHETLSSFYRIRGAFFSCRPFFISAGERRASYLLFLLTICTMMTDQPFF
jgi:hypothetical protein